MAREIFQIENGKLYLTLVDTTAVGYETSWIAPGGDDVAEVVPGDFSTGADLSCQVSSAALTASSTVNTITVPATFCAPEENVPQPASTAYSLDATILQDPHIATGVSAYLAANDTLSAYFMLELVASGPPRAIGVCRVIAGSFGGDARANLTSTLALPVTGRPQFLFGTGVTSVAVPAARSVAKPGSVYAADTNITASDSTNAGKLTAEGFVANPTSAWTTGQKITIGVFAFNWNGTAWAAGAHA